MNQILNQKNVIYQWLAIMYVHKELIRVFYVRILRLKVCQIKHGLRIRCNSMLPVYNVCVYSY